MTQTKNYGVFVFVGSIVTVVMGLIYYACYAAITSKKRKKKKSIFNQTLRLCMVVVITMTGLWCVCDIALPDLLAEATSSTIYYEDLADGWDDRAEVNEDLLNTFIEMSVKAGTLPKGNMKTDEAVEYYQSKGLKESIAELGDNEYYKTIGGLLEIQYQSINANGFQTFTHPWVDFATSGRLTIPCLVHLLLDKREPAADKVTNTDFCTVKETADGNKEVTAVLFAEYDKTTKLIRDFLNYPDNPNPKSVFDPEISKANTQVYKRFPQFAEDIKYIENELSEYLFDFEKYEAPDMNSKMFFGKSPLRG